MEVKIKIMNNFFYIEGKYKSYDFDCRFDKRTFNTFKQNEKKKKEWLKRVADEIVNYCIKKEQPELIDDVFNKETLLKALNSLVDKLLKDYGRRVSKE